MELLYKIAVKFVEYFMPKTYIIYLINASEITMPSKELFLREKKMPYEKIRELLECCLGYKYRSLTEETFAKTSKTEKIKFRDMTGINATKNSYTDFHAMKVEIPRTGEEALKLHKQIFHGDYDCIAYKNEKAIVYRQFWDGAKWFSNNGGSHRAAALYQYDTKNNVDRPISCNVKTLEISTSIRQFALKHSIWICRAINSGAMYSALQKIKDNETLHEQIDLNFLESDNYAIVISKTSFLHKKLSKFLEDKSFDFSEWLLNPNSLGFDKDYFLDIKKWKQ
ncbi:MAG: hypothetical protein HRU43_00530 [Simkaniaceae bacterium]|nr:hypothetical protein [Simkaniaceae bacterium]